MCFYIALKGPQVNMIAGLLIIQSDYAWHYARLFAVQISYKLINFVKSRNWKTSR